MTTADIVAFVIDSFEGKLYTDDPIDTGGATRWGVTLRTLQYCRRKWTNNPSLIVTKTDVRTLTRAEAIKCGVFAFAQEPGIDRIPDWRVRLVVYDYGFHSGQPRAIKALQAAVGVSQDGALGPKTLEALAEQPDFQIAMRVLTSREEFMQDIMERKATQKRFLLGWWRRTTKVQRLVVS